MLKEEYTVVLVEAEHKLAMKTTYGCCACINELAQYSFIWFDRADKRNFGDNFNNSPLSKAFPMGTHDKSLGEMKQFILLFSDTNCSPSLVCWTELRQNVIILLHVCLFNLV